MTPESFQQLYKLIRGSKCAAKVIEAQNLATENDFQGSLANLREARQAYSDHYSRTLKQADLAAPNQLAPPKDGKKQQKLEKIQQAMTHFDQLIEKIERRAQRSPSPLRSESPHHPPSRTPNSAASDQTSDNDSAIRTFNTNTSRSLIKRLRELCVAPTNLNLEPKQLATHFRLEKVENIDDIQIEGVYLIQTQQANVLTQIQSIKPLPVTGESTTHLTSLLDERPIKPVTVKGLLQLASKQSCFLVIAPETGKSETDDTNTQQSSKSTPAPIQSEEAGRDEELGSAEPSGEVQPSKTSTVDHQNILDLGSFSQLLTSAQRSGLVPNADQIGYVRDKEFRQGKYDKAFQSIDMMHNRFLANAGQRLARLSREDVDIAAGRIKISPRELQAKRSRDRVQTQEVDRAKRRFQVVLEGLRILMNHDSESQRGGETED